MQLERVDRLEDPRLDDFRSLKDARLAARSRFVVEGRGCLRVLRSSDSRFVPASILLSERAWAALEAELAVDPPDCPVRIAEQALLDRIVGFPIHRGVLAACERGTPEDALELARGLLARAPAARIVVLEGLTNHDNVGGVFRNARAFGAGGVLLCPRTCDPLYRKAIRTSMGGSLCVPFARSTALPGLLDALRALGVAIWALDPDPAGDRLDRLAPPDRAPVALLLGTEGEGLSEAALARADRRVRIGMAPGVDSLNVAMAAGIALHALRDHDAPEP